jgi:hypothetical protein
MNKREKAAKEFGEMVSGLVSDWVSSSNQTVSDKVAVPLGLYNAKGKQFRQMSDADKSLSDFIKTALLEGYGVAFNGQNFGTLDATLRKNQLAEKYNYEAIMQLNPELSAAELASAVLDICIKATVGNKKVALGFVYGENQHNMKGKTPGSQITRENMVAMLLRNHQLVIAKYPPTAPPFVIGTLDEIRKAIRFERRRREVEDAIRPEKLAAFEADLPATEEEIDKMDPAKLRAIAQKHFPDCKPGNFPQPTDFDPTLSDQELAEQIINALEPFFEDQNVICLAFGRRDGQHWPNVPENTRAWNIACLLNGLFMFVQGVETKRTLNELGTLSDIREMSQRQRREVAAP